MRKNIYDKNWFDINWIHKRTWEKYDKYGFDINWIHKETWTEKNNERRTRKDIKTTDKKYIQKSKKWVKYSEDEWRINRKTKSKYNTSWRDRDWYDKEWYFFNWRDREWYDYNWYNYDWFNREWYDIEWLDKNWEDKNWNNATMNILKTNNNFKFIYEKRSNYFKRWYYNWCTWWCCIGQFARDINSPIVKKEFWDCWLNNVSLNYEALKNLIEWIEFNDLDTPARWMYRIVNDLLKWINEETINYHTDEEKFMINEILNKMKKR